MFILYEQIEEDLVPVRNEYGYISTYEDELDANIERIFLQVECDNLLIVKSAGECKGSTPCS